MNRVIASCHIPFNHTYISSRTAPNSRAAHTANGIGQRAAFPAAVRHGAACFAAGAFRLPIGAKYVVAPTDQLGIFVHINVYFLKQFSPKLSICLF